MWELPLLLTHLFLCARKANAYGGADLVGSRSRKHKPSGIIRRQAQRVAIARAGSRSDALVCEEPTGDLDRNPPTMCCIFLQMLNREHGKSIVMVTHDPKAAAFPPRQLHMERERCWKRNFGLTLEHS